MTSCRDEGGCSVVFEEELSETGWSAAEAVARELRPAREAAKASCSSWS